MNTIYNHLIKLYHNRFLFLNSKKNIAIAVFLSVLFIIVETFIFLGHSYWTFSGTFLADSDVLTTASLAQQILDNGFSWSTLYQVRQRAFFEIFLHFIHNLIFGFKLYSNYFLYTLLFSITFCILSLHISIQYKRKEKKYILDILSLLICFLLISSFYFTSSGHAGSYFLYVIAISFIFFLKYTKKISFFALLIISFWGYLNEDLWLVIIIFPCLMLTFIQWITEKKINWATIPILLGTAIAKILLIYLEKYHYLSTPSDTIYIRKLSDFPFAFFRTIYAYMCNLRLNVLDNKLPISLSLIPIFLYVLLFIFSIIAIAYGIIYLIKNWHFQKDYEYLCFIIITNIALFIAYWLVDIGNLSLLGDNFRYVYFSTILLIILLVKFWENIFYTRRLKIFFLVCVFLIFCFSIIELYQNKTQEAIDIRKDCTLVIDTLKKANQQIAYAEYWTAYMTWAAGNNQVKVYPTLGSSDLYQACMWSIFINNFFKENHAWIVPLYQKEKFNAQKNIQVLIKKFGMPQQIYTTKYHKILIFKENVAPAVIQHVLQ